MYHDSKNIFLRAQCFFMNVNWQEHELLRRLPTNRHRVLNIIACIRDSDGSVIASEALQFSPCAGQLQDFGI